MQAYRATGEATADADSLRHGPINEPASENAIPTPRGVASHARTSRDMSAARDKIRRRVEVFLTSPGKTVVTLVLVALSGALVMRRRWFGLFLKGVTPIAM